MTALRWRRMSEPVLLGPGEGETIGRLAIKAGRPEVVVTESRYEAGAQGPDLHIHRHHADAFWLLDGKLSFQVGPDNQEVVLGADSFVLVPPEVAHTFENPGPGDARFLNFHAPGVGFDEYLRSGFKAPFDQVEPPADGGRPASELILHAPGEGEQLTTGPVEVSIKADGRDALSSLAVMEISIGPGFPGPARPRKAAAVDSYYVLDGVLTLQLDEREVETAAGSYAVVPADTRHTFSNPSDEPVRILRVMAPGGSEQYDFAAV
jgi:mannose-6-phosphate isomerase-like protein (cupin superfamily)